MATTYKNLIILKKVTQVAQSNITVAYSSVTTNTRITTPSGTTKVSFKMWGTGGSGGDYPTNATYHAPGAGGGGGFVYGELSTTGQTDFFITIGDSGSVARSPSGGRGGGAGGYTVVRDTANLIVAMAGAGGGGGGSGGTYVGGAGGAGGGSTGGAGANGSSSTTALRAIRGTGGTQAAGGTGGTGSTGNGGNGENGEIDGRHFGGDGGHASDTADTNPTAGGNIGGGSGGDAYKFFLAPYGGSGGGGGAGYYGGGGGEGGDRPDGAGGGGGGGGSNFVSANLVSTISEQASGRVPPRTTDADYIAGVGYGGLAGTASAAAARGNTGAIIVTYTIG